MIRIVHVSDFHLDNNLLGTNHRVVKPLIEDLAAFHEEDPITTVVCSGDLIDRGGLSFPSPVEAFDAFGVRVVDPLLTGLGLDRSQFVIAPGNHDAVRTADSEFIDSGLRTELTSLAALDKFLESGSSEGVRRMEAFEAFRARFYDGLDQPVDVGDRFACFRYEAEGFRLGVVALDSAWRCYGCDEDDAGSLLVGERTVLAGLNGIGDCDLRVAVHHHPLRYLVPFDREVVEPIIEQEFELALLGHIHSSDVVVTDRAVGLLFASTAPGVLRENALTRDSQYINGYRIIDVDLDERTVVCHDREYVPKKNAFAPSPSSKGAGGASVFRLPTTTEIEQRHYERELVQRIGTQAEEVLNEHLVTHGTDTCAPKTVRELFVAPELVYRDRGTAEAIDDLDEESVVEALLTLDDILGRSDNFLLCGAKETGKTILLDRLFTKMVDEVAERHLIPIRIEWDKLGNRRFESEVNVRTGVGSTGVEALCKEHDVVLLIDDIGFGDGDTETLRRLKDFITAYPRVRVIATHLQENSSEVPIGLLAHNDVLELLPLDIRTFGVRQIRALVVRWFNGSKGSDMAQDIDRIVTLFQTLSLPSNPLAVSIFLWMIEKQERYEPTNGSTMMENFVERLFEKHSAREVLSSRFDSHNKQRLLAEIAHYMYKQDNPDYRVTYADLLGVVDQSLKAKKFDFTPRAILDQFIAMGLFAIRSSDVQFRFRCFFEYFLAKRMQYESTFEAAVLEDELLAFSSEVKYLTGLQRDRTDILALVLDRMEAEFHETQAQLRALGTYDDALNTARSFLGEADADRILGSIEEGRPTNEDLDADQDAQLGMMAGSQGITRKRVPETLFGRLSRLLGLAAAVLKNTEETTEENLKVSAYQRIVSCALVYTVLYKYELMRYLAEHEDEIPWGFESVVRWVADFTPIITQLSLHHELGTQKLNGVFRDEIDRTLADNEVTELERFFAVFLYSDSRGPDYPRYMKRFIQEVNKPYMETNVFLKVISYYYVRSRNKQMDDKLLDLMAELIVKAKKLPAREKGRIMERHRRAKLRMQARGDQQQTALAL